MTCTVTGTYFDSTSLNAGTVAIGALTISGGTTRVISYLVGSKTYVYFIS